MAGNSTLRTRSLWLFCLAALLATTACGGRSVRTLEDDGEAAGDNDGPGDGDGPNDDPSQPGGATSCEALCGRLNECSVSEAECVEICRAANALAEASNCERPYADLLSCYRTLDDFCPTGDSSCTAAANAFNVCTFDYCLENRRECRYD
jgi:hypothetical protein